MPVIQSKDITCGSKHSNNRDHQPAENMVSRSGEMTTDEPFTHSRLQQFTADDFESYRARGEAFRHRLSGAVLNALKLGDIWRTDCESRGEWGGIFPVHLRLTHRRCKHLTIDILSPGNGSPFWHGLMWLNPDHTGLYFWNSELLAADVIGGLLQNIDEMVSAGHKAGDIAAMLRGRGVS
ncbi:conjugation system SOS inhibitor PsiB family protein [Pantoea sp. ME81]|uniref:conjugation system SOS inhibitor PsiB family protein n=1 Tax=Pantoea sp. ME81 TaxID=2743935 RepID=UPI0015F5FBFB|nr:conjugation system SOS inhibitor PsiB family protein [Pantoea sp. ME81]